MFGAPFDDGFDDMDYRKHNGFPSPEAGDG
jgi:hypothetical protein